ncbi:hypothetical protein B5F09_12120 [Erysipelatoclostridium sp. An173]|nr:hypothetical protein B5F09_12120 [Erysipelatoclostridium sp. An173]
MAIYSITYILNALGFYMNKRDSKIIKALVILLLVFISGTRYYMGGSDVYVYEAAYNSVPSPSIVLNYFFTGVNNGVNTSWEVGFLLLCSIIKSFGFSYFGFILIWTIIFYTLMVKGLNEFVPSWSIFFAVFMYKLMFYDTFISIRQGLTIAMFCYMLKYIRDRKWYIYFPLCYIALLEHNGAVFLFPLYFVTYIPTSKKFIRRFSLVMAPTWFISSKVDISNLIMLGANFLGSSKGEHWVEATEKISIIHTIECYVMVILILIFYEKIISNEKNGEVKLVLQLFLLVIPMFTIFREWIIFTREKDYLVLMYGIILGYVLKSNTMKNIEYRNGYCVLGSRNEQLRFKNKLVFSLGIFIVCFVGMIRYVLVFDGGELATFTSFITEGASIFID